MVEPPLSALLPSPKVPAPRGSEERPRDLVPFVAEGVCPALRSSYFMMLSKMRIYSSSHVLLGRERYFINLRAS